MPVVTGVQPGDEAAHAARPGIEVAENAINACEDERGPGPRTCKMLASVSQQFAFFAGCFVVPLNAKAD